MKEGKEHEVTGKGRGREDREGENKRRIERVQRIHEGKENGDMI